MARAMLGQWEEAAKDLHVASNLDYDEEIAAALKKVASLDCDRVIGSFLLFNQCGAVLRWRLSDVLKIELFW